jgi:non-homologous end joining protein Ku
MRKDDQYILIKDEILQITHELKSHIHIGEFVDPDKNFMALLDKIIVS